MNQCGLVTRKTVLRCMSNMFDLVGFVYFIYTPLHSSLDIGTAMLAYNRKVMKRKTNTVTQSKRRVVDKSDTATSEHTTYVQTRWNVFMNKVIILSQALLVKIMAIWNVLTHMY